MSREGAQEVGLSGCVYCGDNELTDFGSHWNCGISVEEVLPRSPYAPRLLEEVVKYRVSLRKQVVLQCGGREDHERMCENFDQTLASLIVLGRGCC